MNFSNSPNQNGDRVGNSTPVTAVFAHRGCTRRFRENTLEAFTDAKRLGADGVELDVRLTSDGALAVHHEPEISGLGPIAALTVSHLPPYVPLLPDALAACEGLTVNVEIKNDPEQPGYDPGETVAALTAATIAECGWTDRVIVSSFHASTLRAVQAADNRLALGALWRFLADPEAGLVLAVDEGWSAVHPFVTEVTATLVDAAHAAGLSVNPWTVNARHDLLAFTALGVDALITDHLVEAVAIANGEVDAE
jgi:glycerophosphoryl diester phosphodiesterase